MIDPTKLTDSSDVAYKFNDNGKWTALLAYVKTKPLTEGNLYIFKPQTDNESTLETHVINIFIAADENLKTGKTFVMCKFYGTWEKESHVCGKDCHLGK